MNWNPRGGTQSLLIYSLLSVRDNNNNNNNTKIKALLLLELELKQQEAILKHLSHTIRTPSGGWELSETVDQLYDLGDFFAVEL